MLLPGISGSFLLLILGAYAPVLLAVKTLDVTKLRPWHRRPDRPTHFQPGLEMAA